MDESFGGVILLDCFLREIIFGDYCKSRPRNERRKMISFWRREEYFGACRKSSIEREVISLDSRIKLSILSGNSSFSAGSPSRLNPISTCLTFLNPLNMTSIYHELVSFRPREHTSSHRREHIFKPSHSTPLNGSPSNPCISQNRFPVNRKVRNFFNGKQISPTVFKDRNKFLDKSRSSIWGHVSRISWYEFDE
jgi:hypothetical protein